MYVASARPLMSRADTQLRARQPVFEPGQLMTERGKQQEIKPHTPFRGDGPDFELARWAGAPVVAAAADRFVGVLNHLRHDPARPPLSGAFARVPQLG